MKRLLVSLAVAALIAAGCSPEPSDPPAVGVVAEVEIPGAPNALTHGNDPLPPKPPGLTAQVAPEFPWPCEGTGTEGRRVQLLYVHGGADNLAALRSTFEVQARQIEGTFLTSARETGGERLLRFVTDASCALSVLPVQVSSTALSSFDQMITELRNQGFTDPNRAYHAWVDANFYCGIGTVYSDDRPTGNLNESNAQYARSDRQCWTAQVAAHEIVHNLGGVQNSAPNSTGGLHCRDEFDVMCYADGAPKGQMTTVCPDRAADDRLDCGKDDYFSTAPVPGSYLATHWNVAESAALLRSGPTPTTLAPPPPTTSTTVPPTTTTSLGKGKTVTELTVPTIRRGEAFTATAQVTGECRPTGTVAFFVSGKLMSRQVLDAGSASVVLTITGAVKRPTIRADYSGSDTCNTSRDTVRKTVSG